MPLDPMIARGVEAPDLTRPLILAEEIKNRRQTNALYATQMQLQQQRQMQAQEEAQLAQTQEAEKQQAIAVYHAAKAGNPMARNFALKKLSETTPGIFQGMDADTAWTQIEPIMRQTLGVDVEQDKSPFGTVSPDKFTPDSLARFQQSGNYADLAPIEKPAASGRVEFPGGSVTFGPGGQPNYEPTKTGNATRSALEKAFVDAQGNAMSLQQALQGWRPEFSTYAGQFKAAAGNVQEKAGITVDPQTRQYLEQYNTWRSNVSAALSQYLNQLSGAAISPNEEARLKSSFPNDGDGPTEYYQKTVATMRRLSLVQARSAYLLSNPSVTLDSVSLDQMQNIMVAEANKLAAMYEKNGGLTPEQAKQKALQDTRARFGIGGQ